MESNSSYCSCFSIFRLSIALYQMEMIRIVIFMENINSINVDIIVGYYLSSSSKCFKSISS